MRWCSIVLAAGLLSSCGGDKRASLLEQDYAQATTTADQCRLAKQLADIYLSDGDEANYKKWRDNRDVDCLAAGAGVP